MKSFLQEGQQQPSFTLFSTIVIFINQLVSHAGRWFSRQKDPWKEWGSCPWSCVFWVPFKVGFKRSQRESRRQGRPTRPQCNSCGVFATSTSPPCRSGLRGGGGRLSSILPFAEMSMFMFIIIIIIIIIIPCWFQKEVVTTGNMFIFPGVLAKWQYAKTILYIRAAHSRSSWTLHFFGKTILVAHKSCLFLDQSTPELRLSIKQNLQILLSVQMWTQMRSMLPFCKQTNHTPQNHGEVR